MSCRVFTRGLEECVLNWLRDEAKRRGCTTVAGDFAPTARNGYARRFMETLGCPVSDSGTTRYEVAVDAPDLPTAVSVC